MAILNITPDSFFDGGKNFLLDHAIAKARELINVGADIIDIGAVSTRPGAEDVTIDEELKRLIPVVKKVRSEFPDVIISIDTYRAEVVKELSKFDIDIVNDISGGDLDPSMYDTVAGLQLAYVVMHMQGTPKTMQNNPDYKDVTKEVAQNLAKKIELLKQKGVNDIIVDPGFGFGKTTDQNYRLLNNLDFFLIFNLPVMAGISRKSLVYKTIGKTPYDSLNASTALNLLALLKGVSILRVHDVNETKDLVKIFLKLKENNG